MHKRNSIKWTQQEWYFIFYYTQKSLTSNLLGGLQKLPKEGKNVPSELHNFWTIDFGEILAAFDYTNEGSRL